MKKELGILILAIVAAIGFSGAAAAQPMGPGYMHGPTYGHHMYMHHYYKHYYYRHHHLYWYWDVYHPIPTLYHR